MIIMNNYSKTGTYILLESSGYSIVEKHKIQLVRQGVGGFSEAGQIVGIYVEDNKLFFYYNGQSFEAAIDNLICKNSYVSPNVRYITGENYKYTTDELRRIVDVNAEELVLGKCKRNKAMQVAVGREDRLFDDDGGHLIGTQFRGSGDIDNLFAQNRYINRSSGEWYKMETEWANGFHQKKYL